LFQLALQALRRLHDQIERERARTLSPDPNGLGNFIVCRHDHQQVDVAFLVRLAVRIGTKEDDLLGMEPFGNLAGKAPNCRKRDIR
jgi:hypothetical protein